MILSVLIGVTIVGIGSGHLWPISNGQLTPVEYYLPYQPPIQLNPVSEVSRETLEVSSFEANDGSLKKDPDEQHQDPIEDEQQQEEEQEEQEQESKKPDISKPCEGQVPMPYAFEYETDLMSRKETADDKGVVQGTYTYIDGAGVKRTVTYTADANGFVAKGDINPHIPSNEESNRPTTLSKENPGQLPILPTLPKSNRNDITNGQGGPGVKGKGRKNITSGRKPSWGTGGLSGWNGA